MLPSCAWTFPLYAQVLLAVLCGATLGAAFGQHPYLVWAVCETSI